MLRVTIEYWPTGHYDIPEIIGTMAITNDGSGDHDTGNYDVRTEFKYPFTDRWSGVNHDGHVRNHDRTQQPWILVKKALMAITQEGNR